MYRCRPVNLLMRCKPGVVIKRTSRMHDLILDDSQFVIATHSPILMAYPDACIYRCDKDGLTQVAYQDTEHFKITRDFLANPERMLRILMER